MSGTTSERIFNEARLLILTKLTHNRTLGRMALVKCMNIRPLQMQCKMFALKMGEKMDDDGYED